VDGSENDLRDAYRAATGRPPGPCPDAEALASLTGAVGGPVDEAIRAQVVDHVARCANCADELKTLFALREVIDTAVFAPAGVQDHSDDPAPLRWLTAWARWRSNPARSIPVMLVVLAAVLGVTYVVWRSTYNAPIVDERERSATAWVIATVPSDRATLATAPNRLEWTSAAAAESYRVTLYDAESTPIWESPIVSTPFVDIPGDVRARLTAGQPVFWRVVALSGIDRRESGLHRFTIVTGPAPSP
jgi:hypothetical protein